MVISSEKLIDSQELKQSLGAAVQDSRRLQTQVHLKFKQTLACVRSPQSNRKSLMPSHFALAWYYNIFQDLEDVYTHLWLDKEEHEYFLVIRP